MRKSKAISNPTVFKTLSGFVLITLAALRGFLVYGRMRLKEIWFKQSQTRQVFKNLSGFVLITLAALRGFFGLWSDAFERNLV